MYSRRQLTITIRWSLARVLFAASSGLAILSSAGCNSFESTTSEQRIDPEIRASVQDYWSAFIQREWDGQASALPNWRKAYNLLHPEARAKLTLVAFNQRNWDWVKGKPGFICELRFEDAEVFGDSANATVVIHFGQSERPEVSCRIRMHLKREGSRWAVVSSEE